MSRSLLWRELRARGDALRDLPERVRFFLPRGGGHGSAPVMDATLEEIRLAVVSLRIEIRALERRRDALKRVAELAEQAGAQAGDRALIGVIAEQEL